MKKVGIMTMHRVVNYGSYLQAYGLRKIIKSLGHEVEFLDYHYCPGVTEVKPPTFFEKVWDNRDIFHYIKRRKLYKNFKNELDKGLKEFGVGEEKNYSHDIDTLVIGSDEVFNCLQASQIGYSLDFFGKGFEDKNVISYAASFGYTTLEGLKKYKKAEEIKECLLNMNNISVRDENSREIVEKLTKKKPFLHYDPVIAADLSEFMVGDAPMKDYIIVYAYQKRLTKEEEKYIKRFAKKHNKKIVSLGFYQKIADYNIAVPVNDVLRYFKYADFIITDTFHGTIFSIVTNNKFCTIIRKSNKNKLTSLLKGLDKDSQIVNKLTDIDKIYDKKINYKNTNSIIKKERERTIKYLKENI